MRFKRLLNTGKDGRDDNRQESHYTNEVQQRWKRDNQRL